MTKYNQNRRTNLWDINLFPVLSHFRLETPSLRKGDARPFRARSNMFREIWAMLLELLGEEQQSRQITSDTHGKH